nr:MAG TPA: hypothetical protein [Caudoviricetes sp.]
MTYTINPPTALDRQVGGNHYKKYKIQPVALLT